MTPAALLPGAQIGSWRVVGLRGRGAYGAVYRVERTGQADSRSFALKLALHPLDPRFEREGELLSRLLHPHVPRLEARGWWVLPGGVPFPYLVMEWVEGVPLYEWAAQHPLTSRQALRLLAQVARALEATHAVGGVHRDVKGDNVLVREDISAVLMDFGSGDYRGARTLPHQPPPPGTPQYQSPESLRFQWQWRPSTKARYEATPADDIYALGVMAYRLVSGRYPPPAVDIEETGSGARFVLLPRVSPERWVSLCPALAALIHQLLSPEPSERGSAGQVAQALERAARTAGPAADQPIISRPEQAPAVRTRQPVPPRAPLAWSQWLAAAVGVFLMASAGWVGYQRSEEQAVAGYQTPGADGPKDEDPVGLGETTLSAPAGVALPEPARAGLSLDMPNKPLPGQRRPPCEKHAIEINGGCWARWDEVTPPCGPSSYTWKGRCYLPLFGPPRPETSGQP